jgi:lipoate-protein ligase A
VILDGYKIGGSAQRRGKQALLQHGSILLRKSDFAPELPGIEDLSGKPLDPHCFGENLLVHLQRELDLQFRPSAFSALLAARAGEVEQATFTANGWNRNR